MSPEISAAIQLMLQRVHHAEDANDMADAVAEFAAGLGWDVTHLCHPGHPEPTRNTDR
jgi:hypothetical protein